jgi:hypothetical protein
MTDLSDTAPAAALEADAVVARRRPSGRTAVLAIGAAVVVSSLVSVARLERDRFETATPPSTAIHLDAADTTSTSGVKVASSPPIAPCVSWRFGADQSKALTVAGAPCVQAAVVWAGAAASSGVLSSSPADVGPIDDPMLLAPSAAITGQIYADTVVMPERDAESGIVSVVARSTSTFEQIWAHSCDNAETTPAVHFSGGEVARDAAANRTDIDVFGVIEYVAISCEGQLALHDPSTGAVIGADTNSTQ